VGFGVGENMLYTFILKGSHTIGNLVVSEAMCDSHRSPSDLVAYRVPHSLNDQVHITVEAATEGEARALLRRACERLVEKLVSIMTTPPRVPLVASARTTIVIRIGTILTDSDIK